MYQENHGNIIKNLTYWREHSLRKTAEESINKPALFRWWDPLVKSPNYPNSYLSLNYKKFKIMKFKIALILIAVIYMSSGCNTKQASMPIVGTWELISATTTEKDTTFSTFDPSHKMIKIINPTHFAFLNHAINPKKDSSNAFTAGGGKYTLVDSVYTESLDYYIDKAWENNKFPFAVKIVNDTLIQKGLEKVEKLGIDRVIIEKYKRVID